MVDNNKNEHTHTHTHRETRRLVYEKNDREKLTRERRRETKVELHIVGKEREEMGRVGRGNLETLDGISEIDRLLPTVVSCDRWQLVSIVGSRQREFANEKSDRNYFRKILSGRCLPWNVHENGNSLSLSRQRSLFFRRFFFLFFLPLLSSSLFLSLSLCKLYNFTRTCFPVTHSFRKAVARSLSRSHNRNVSLLNF